MWSDAEEEILAGDRTAALAYATPASGGVATPVAPIGMRDRDARTVSFTTSLGFGRKLDRITRNPRVALAYHAREHGFASEPRFVLVQGTASFQTRPDRSLLEEVVRPASARFMGAPRTGPFWDRWLSAYYADRILVTVAVERVCSWSDRRCTGEPSVYGAARPATDPEPQSPPRNGTRPRVDAARARRRLAKLRHVLLAYIDRDGFPVVVPVGVGAASDAGIALSAASPPPGGRRAGLLGHSFRAQLVGLEARQHTGWLESSIYAPHTESGFRAPANKTLLLLANGFMARQGLRRARARGAA
jgi:hypothetical protein